MLQTPTFKSYQYSNHPDLKQHAQVSREAAAESMVLLKDNGNALPIKNSASVAVFGNHAYDLIAGGTGSGDVNKAYAVSLAEGLTNAGYKTDKDVQQAYVNYLNDYCGKTSEEKSAYGDDESYTDGA